MTVTTADNKELVTLLSFTMTEPWYASPLPADDSAVRTDGTLKYAYAPAACTVNGVAFAAAGNGNAAISGDISWPYSQTSGASAPSSVSGAYYELLNRCWWANQGDKEVTLKNLEAGRSYLAQIFGYRNYNGDGKAHVWIKESYWDPNFIKVYGDGWSCGGTLTGTFTATETTKTFTITSDGNYGINGIQVRDLGESGVPVVVLPEIGSVSVSTNGSTASPRRRTPTPRSPCCASSRPAIRWSAPRSCGARARVACGPRRPGQRRRNAGSASATNRFSPASSRGLRRRRRSGLRSPRRRAHP